MKNKTDLIVDILGPRKYGKRIKKIRLANGGRIVVSVSGHKILVKVSEVVY